MIEFDISERATSCWISKGENYVICRLNQPGKEIGWSINAASGEFAEVGIQPSRLRDLIMLLRDPRPAKWPTTFISPVDPTKVIHSHFPTNSIDIVVPNARTVALRARQNGNPVAKVSLTREEAKAFAEALESLLATVPQQVAKLRQDVEETYQLDELRSVGGRPKFTATYPRIRDDVEALVGEQRYAAAQAHFHKTYLAWAEKHPVDMAKVASTEGGQAAIQAVLDALRK